MVSVDALDDAGAAECFQPPDVTADIAVGVTAGDANRAALGERTMRARPVLAAVAGDFGDVAIGSARTGGRRADLDDASHGWRLTVRGIR